MKKHQALFQRKMAIKHCSGVNTPTLTPKCPESPLDMASLSSDYVDGHGRLEIFKTRRYETINMAKQSRSMANHTRTKLRIDLLSVKNGKIQKGRCEKERCRVKTYYTTKRYIKNAEN